MPLINYTILLFVDGWRGWLGEGRPPLFETPTQLMLTNQTDTSSLGYVCVCTVPPTNRKQEDHRFTQYSMRKKGRERGTERKRE